VLLRDLSNRSKRGLVSHREIGQHFAINLDVGSLQPLDEAAVRDAIHTRGCVDPDDPKSAEIALSRLAVSVGVRKRSHERLMGTLVKPVVSAAVTLNLGNHCAVTAVSRDASFNASHGCSSFPFLDFEDFGNSITSRD
jgi:hypothetical protein